jgi:hypothetical protein
VAHGQAREPGRAAEEEQRRSGARRKKRKVGDGADRWAPRVRGKGAGRGLLGCGERGGGGPAGKRRSGRASWAERGKRRGPRVALLGQPAFLFPFLFFFKPTQIYLNSTQI